MKFWKSLKSSSGSWSKGPTNGTEDDNGSSRSTGNQALSTNKRHEQRGNGNSSQLHSVRTQTINFHSLSSLNLSPQSYIFVKYDFSF